MKWQRAPAPAGPEPGEGEVDPDDRAPSAWGRIREVAWHLPRMLSGLGPLGPRGPEDGPPGWSSPLFGTDRTTMELRRALARAGWRAHPWLLGINLGAKKDTLKLLCKRLRDLEDPRQVLVVGWSLGGMFARQLAYRCPDRVRAVVTLASPFSGDLKTNTNVREIYERVAGHDVNEPPFEVRPGKPPVRLWRSGTARGDRRSSARAPGALGRPGGQIDPSMDFAVYRPSRVGSSPKSHVPDRNGRQSAGTEAVAAAERSRRHVSECSLALL